MHKLGIIFLGVMSSLISLGYADEAPPRKASSRIRFSEAKSDSTTKNESVENQATSEKTANIAQADLNERENEFQVVKKKLGGLSLQIARLQTLLEEMEEKPGDTVEHFQNMKKKMIVLCSQIEALEEICASCQKLSKKNEETISNADECKPNEVAVNGNQNNYPSMAQVNEEICKELDQLFEEVACINEQIRKIENENQNLKSTQQTISSLSDRLSDRLNRLDQQTAKLQTKICNDETHYEIECIACEIDDLRCRINTLESECYVEDIFYTHPFIEQNCFTIGAEFLYWTVKEGELHYVVKGGPLVLAPGQNNFGATGDLQSAHFDWKPGFRVYLGYTHPCSFWQLLGQYTYFRTHGSDSTTPPEDATITGTFSQILPGGPETPIFVLATSEIEFKYHILDILISRRIALAPQLSSTLQMGFVGANIKQDWTVEYVGEGVTPIPTPSDTLTLDWRFAGGGLKAGAALDWYFGCGWSLTGAVNAGILYGHYKNQLKQDIFVGGEFFYTHQNTRNSDHRFVETLQLQLGPKWSTCWCGHEFSLYALYELNTWLNLHEVYRSFIENNVRGGTDSRHSNAFLGLHGLTLGLNARF